MMEMMEMMMLQKPTQIIWTNDYRVYEWKVRGNKELFDRFNVYHYLKKIENSSPNAIW